MLFRMVPWIRTHSIHMHKILAHKPLHTVHMDSPGFCAVCVNGSRAALAIKTVRAVEAAKQRSPNTPHPHHTPKPHRTTNTPYHAWIHHIASHLASMCVEASHRVKVAVVVGFPLGSSTTEAKVAELQHYLSLGADEFDMVGVWVCVVCGAWCAVRAVCGVCGVWSLLRSLYSHMLSLFLGY